MPSTRSHSVRWRVASIATSLAVIVSTRAFWWPTSHVVSYDGATYSGPNTEVSMAALRQWRIPFL
ncbi:MAG: hypothetical protein ACPHAQ_05800, partial [Ilumatobacteraceae bacterium]